MYAIRSYYVLQLAFQLGQIGAGALRRGVAAVSEGVNEDFTEPLPSGQLNQGVEVGVVGVHAAIGKKTHQMP